MTAGLSRTHIGLVILALLLRLIWVGAQSWRDGGALTYDDERLHWQLASNLVQRGVLVSDDGRYAARTPLYPLFLALFAALGPAGVIAARVAQALFATITVTIGVALANRIAGRRSATVAGLLLCFDPFSIFFASLLLNETLFAAALLALIALLYHTRLASEFQTSRSVALAMLSTALVLLRPESIGLLAIFAFAAALSQGFKSLGRNLAPIFANFAISGVLLAVGLGVWGWRNHTIFGEWVLLSCNGGVTLYDGVGPQADGSSNQAFLRNMPELAAMTEPQRDRRLTVLALEEIGRDPARVMHLALRKIGRTWNLRPNVESHRTGMAAMASAVYTLAALALFAAAILRHRRRVVSHWPLWLPLVFSLIVTAVYVGSVRYRVPYMPAVCVLAGFVHTSELRSSREIGDRIQQHHE